MRPSRYAAAYCKMDKPRLLEMIAYWENRGRELGRPHLFREAISRMNQAIKALDDGDDNARETACGQAAFAENRALAGIDN